MQRQGTGSKAHMHAGAGPSPPAPAPASVPAGRLPVDTRPAACFTRPAARRRMVGGAAATAAAAGGGRARCRLCACDAAVAAVTCEPLLLFRSAAPGRSGRIRRRAQGGQARCCAAAAFGKTGQLWPVPRLRYRKEEGSGRCKELKRSAGAGGVPLSRAGAQLIAQTALDCC